MTRFSHLHVHSKYSILDGASDISQMFKKAVNDGMPGIALTDHGNMFGAFKFIAEAEKYNIKGQPPVIKPVIGCEFYVVENRHQKQFTRENKDVRYHQLFLARNAEGYNNLVKLCSLGYIDGLYSKYPRIDKELILKYHKGLIATTCCLAAEVPRAIMNKSEVEAEKAFKWWLDLFGEDYYVEIQRHGIPEQEKVNEILLGFAKKYNVKTIATNDSHYVEQDFANAHDILLCVNTGELKSTPTLRDYNDDEVTVKGKRFAFYNDQFYFKNTGQMIEIFNDLPEAIDNTNEIIDKVELLNLKKDIMLPHFQLPDGKTDQFEYLYEKTFEGVRKKYGNISPEVEERIHFELDTIKKMGFTGYFLIVSDFISAGRDLGVFVGPGRGSAAGSVVAYCIGITNIDPLKYNLLFERFLNPDRKSMPDIDTDFDDDGRQKVIDYVVEKYGRNQVAQIVTFGTMAAKSSIKDVARVLDLPLNDSNALAKLVPERPGIELKRVMHAPLTGKDSLAEKEALNNEDLDGIKKLRDIANGTDLRAEVLKEAVKLEGSVRGTGMHAAGIIIAPSDLTDIIPVATSKETNLLITQFEGKEIEDAGVIKMDFLGLKTLSILRDALELIEQNHKIKINLDEIPLDDKKTLELFQRGETNGTFQFESPGMQKHLRELKPDKFEDLIAMNALYRPGPLEYIPNFIARKFGREKVTYDTPEMEEYLKETYGITVYQEQLMLLSQKLAGFSKGDADLNKYKAAFATGRDIHTLADAMKDADIFLGLSKANCVTKEMVCSMAKNRIIFAMANPDPEITYDDAMSACDDLIMATGRSDFPNQVNNVLGFPYIFRGALDVRATCINEEMKIAAVYALASLAKEMVPESVSKAYNVDNLAFGKDYIIPKPLDPRLITTVAPAVAKAAMESGVARKPITDWEAYKLELSKRLGLDNQLFHNIVIKAKQNPKRVVFPEGNNIKVLRAASEVSRDGIAKPILLGNPDEIQRIIADNHIELNNTSIIDIQCNANREARLRFADLIWKKRQRKGCTIEESYDLTFNRNVYGVMMVETGEADAMISGVTSHYGDVISPALKLIGPKPGLNRISSMSIVMTKKRPLFFADTTVNLDPDVQTLVDTTLLTAEEVRKFNIEPVIALVSYSNFGSVKISERTRILSKTRQAIEILHRDYPDLIVDGEIQMDFALNKELRSRKFPFSLLENKDVNTLIFPNLTSGNIAHKLMAEVGGAEVLGPVLMGMNKPIHVIPTECSARDIANMATIAVLDAQ